MVESEAARHETQRATTGSGTLGEELEKALEHGKELELKLAQSNRELLIERANVQNAVLHKEQATKAYEGAHEALKIAVDRVEQMSHDLAKAKNAIEKANFKTDQFEQMCKDLAKAQNALDEANFKKDALSLNLSQYQMKVKTAFDENEKMAKELLDLRAYQRTSQNDANAHVAELEKRLEDVWEVVKEQSKVQQHDSEIQTQEKDELKTKILKMEEELKGANESAEEQVMYLASVNGQIGRLPVKHIHSLAVCVSHALSCAKSFLFSEINFQRFSLLCLEMFAQSTKRACELLRMSDSWVCVADRCESCGSLDSCIVQYCYRYERC